MKNIIFSELYSLYYQTVSRILRKAQTGMLTDAELRQMIQETAFSDSILTVEAALKTEKWMLLTADLHTPIVHSPTMPISLLERRWLKAISLDPRVKLFGASFTDLDDIEPLFTPADFVFFDRYSDGDPYDDPAYMTRFRVILDAIQHHQALSLTIHSRHDHPEHMTVVPSHLEYSEKDDKFRLVTCSRRKHTTINLNRIIACAAVPNSYYHHPTPPKYVMQTLVLLVTDERNSLQRALLHFAHFEKRAEQLDAQHYRITIRYAQEDETELVIRVLSFGPFLRVIAPDAFVECIRARLRQQQTIEKSTV